MLDINIPKKIVNLLELIRFNKPIGFMLLLWPCLFSLANISQNQYELLSWYIYFIIGAFLMRSAGCIINDFIDINIDKKIERTSTIPLASGLISKIEAMLFLFVLLVISFVILLQFNFKAIFFGILSLPLIFLYPYMKRYTYWPQLILGIVFNWGVIIVAIQFFDKINLNFFILYGGCIFWTLAYDTIYAYQDVEDDIRNGIKSTAVLFKKSGKIYVLIFYMIFFLTIIFLGFINTGSIFSLILAFLMILSIFFYINKWNLQSKESSNYYFKFNNFIGLSCFIYLIIF